MSPYQTTAIDPLVNAGIAHKVYPNPFNEKVHISFEHPGNQSASLEIYNLSGQRLVLLTAPSYQQSFVWDGKDAQGKNLPAGVYTYRLRVGEKRGSGKLLLGGD